jgi:PP-loop superfamily ATP-utilizing enzyme
VEKVIQEELPKQPPKFHEVFPIKLEHKDKRLNENKTCYFQCKEHLDSYLKRYKLKTTEYQISDTEEK